MANANDKSTFLNRRVINMILCAALIYVMFVLFIYLNQGGMLYSPDTSRPDVARSGIPEMSNVTVQPADMKEGISGWYRAPADPSKFVVLYFHGNAGNIGNRVPKIVKLVTNGYGILLGEYRGFGGNPGELSEDGFYADADAYYDWLVKEEGIPENRIILYGESLGTGVATYLATKHLNVGGVILESPFTSMRDLYQRRLFMVPMRLLLRDNYDSIDRIGDINAPLLIIHGVNDMIVPVNQAQRLFASANQPKTLKLIPDAGHNDLYDHNAANIILEFLTSLKKQ